MQWGRPARELPRVGFGRWGAPPGKMASPTLDALLRGAISGGVSVLFLSFHRSTLSPQFYNNTGLAVVPGVDYTFDAEVVDGAEKARV